MPTGWDIVASGYGLIESPTWIFGEGIAYSDVLRGGVYLMPDDGSPRTLVPKRRGVGGIAAHADGGVLVTGRSLQHVRDGITRTVLDKWPDTGFNDLGVAPDGSVVIGSLRGDVGDLSEGRGGGPALLLRPGHEPRTVLDRLAFANGVAFSTTGRRCYIADSADRLVRWIDLDDGSVTGSGVLTRIENGRPDGIVVDAEDGVWVSCFGAALVVRVDTDGTVTHRVPVGIDDVACVAFAGDDCADLVVGTATPQGVDGATGVLLRAASPVPGLLPNLARI